MIAAALFLLFGAVTIGYGILSLVRTQPGWQEIRSLSSEASCAGDFTLLYEPGAGETAAGTEGRALTALYTQACQDAYRIFQSAESFSDGNGLWDLNRHPNEILSLSPALYDALALLDRYGDRYIYLAPAYEVYDGAFLCAEDWEAAMFDPTEDPALADYFGRIAAFAADPAQVDLELLGEDRARLSVSEEYLAFAAENGIERFIDLGWAKNAFIIDYLAGVLTEGGYTHGVLSSADGFVRNLDGRGVDFTLDLPAWEDGAAVTAAGIGYTGPMAVAALRGFPAAGDGGRVYVRSDGSILSPYLSLADGLPVGAGRDLVGMSRETGCAELLLRMLPGFFSDAPETAAGALARDDALFWQRDRVIYAAGTESAPAALREGYTMEYVA